MSDAGFFPRPDEPRLPVTTMDLLNMALKRDHLGAWAQRLGLSNEALRTARSRGGLSPMVAGALAKDLEQDPAKWIVIASLETARESACKTRMIQHFADTEYWPRLHRQRHAQP
jgi:hypothetical protein